MGDGIDWVGGLGNLICVCVRFREEKDYVFGVGAQKFVTREHVLFSKW